MRKMMILSLLWLFVCGCTQRGEHRKPPANEPWFNPIGTSIFDQTNTWIPDPGVIAEMKAALDEALQPVLAAHGDSTRPPTSYWFQYMARGSGNDRNIFIVGSPFPAPQAAPTTFSSVYIPEVCHLSAVYVPGKKQIVNLMVGGLRCPRRI